jgi:hypothetical protein
LFPTRSRHDEPSPGEAITKKRWLDLDALVFDFSARLLRSGEAAGVAGHIRATLATPSRVGIRTAFGRNQRCRSTAGGANKMKRLSLEETREKAALTDTILENLKAINSDELAEMYQTTNAILVNLEIIRDIEKNLNLDILAELTGSVAANLQVINEDENDLDQMAELTGTIAANLEVINDDENDLADLATKTNEIVAALGEIKAKTAGTT